MVHLGPVPGPALARPLNLSEDPPALYGRLESEDTAQRRGRNGFPGVLVARQLLPERQHLGQEVAVLAHALDDLGRLE